VAGEPRSFPTPSVLKYSVFWYLKFVLKFVLKYSAFGEQEDNVYLNTNMLSAVLIQYLPYFV